MPGGNCLSHPLSAFPVPFQASAGLPDDTVNRRGWDFNFSRTPVDAVIDLRGIGETGSSFATSITGAFVDDEDIDCAFNWGDKIRTTYIVSRANGWGEIRWPMRAAEAWREFYRMFGQTI